MFGLSERLKITKEQQFINELKYKNWTKDRKVFEALKMFSNLDMFYLNQISYRYGSCIHNLRKDGHKIYTHCVKKGHFTYTLIND